MSGFTKLVPEIVQSSIWNESPEVRCVWITMLAVKDKDGYVRGNAATLARIANVGKEAVEEALTTFQSPDPDSNTPDHEGRRIQAIPGGWFVLNHELYRAKDYRDYEAERKRKQREKKQMSRTCPGQVPDSSASVSVSVSGTGKEGEGGKGAAKPKKYPDDFEAAWAAFGRYGAKPVACKYWRRLNDLDKACIMAAIPPYLACVEAGRTKKQFEGWINPEKRAWEIDWEQARKEWLRTNRRDQPGDRMRGAIEAARKE